MPHKDPEARKAYHAEYGKGHYERTKDRYRESRAASRDRIRDGNRECVREHLSVHPCVDCGESDIRVLEFDHLDATTKVKDVMKLISGSRVKLLAEIAKCEVVCANCHRIRTCERAGSWRLALSTG